jgi:hypothetical protein
MRPAVAILIAVVLASIASAADAAHEGSVNYDLLGHMMVVEARINDSEEEYTFAVDTGGLTFLDKAIADELGLKQQPMMAKIDRLEIDSLEIDRIFCFTTFDFSRFKALGKPIKGIIGSDLMERYRMTLDFDRRTLTFSGDSTALEVPEGGLLLPFRNHPVNNAPLVAFTVGDIGLEGMIDTGQPYPVVFPLGTFEDYKDRCLTDYVRSRGLMEEWPSTNADHNYVARMKSLGFQNVSYDSVICLFGELPPMLSMPLIGTDFLSKFEIVIDYPHHEILLVPTSASGPPTNMFTVGLRPRISPEGLISVAGVLEGSPSDRAGIEVGDGIESFGSVKLTPANLIDLFDALKDDGIPSIILGIAGPDTTSIVKLEKEMLF